LGIVYRAELLPADVVVETDVVVAGDVVVEADVDVEAEVVVAAPVEVLVTDTDVPFSEASADAHAPRAASPSRIDRALRTRLTRTSRRCTRRCTDG
jgi:hypothetical protein